jgi:AcrR family transcriptional regulator
MPEQKISKETLLEAALELVRTKGESSLSARTIAEAAHCSVQPIYSLFNDMQGLATELYEYARQWVRRYNLDNANIGSNLFQSNGFVHLQLASTERNLFHFLYLSRHMQAHSIEEMFTSISLDGVEECIQELGGLSPENAHELYLNMIIYSHGLASMLAIGASFSAQELAERIDIAFRSFVSLIGRKPCANEFAD